MHQPDMQVGDSDILRRWRLKLGLIQKELGELLGTHKLPLELKKLYVRCHNDKKDFEETTASNDCRRGKLLVSVEGWLRMDNAGQILEDQKRKVIFQQRLKIGRLEGRKDNRQLLDKINEKLAQLQYQLDILL